MSKNNNRIKLLKNYLQRIFPFHNKSLVFSVNTKETFYWMIEQNKKKREEKEKIKEPLHLNNNALELQKNLEEEIDYEKRKRYQTYTLIDYLLSMLTYFDFFSSDTFAIAKKSKYLAQICYKAEVPSEFILLPFFHSYSELNMLLEDFGLEKEELSEFISNLQDNLNISKKLFIERFLPFLPIELLTDFEDLLNFIKDKLHQNNEVVNKLLISIKIFQKKIKNLEKDNKNLYHQKIPFSYEVNSLFEKASENAINRFKTPIISLEILFITLMEAKNSKAGKALKNFLGNEMEWYLLRYKLLKHLHNQESTLRSEVAKNYHFFAYLLKRELSDYEFDILLERNILSEAVLFFRNQLVASFLQINLFDVIEKEVHESIFTTSNRKYS
jgi:hypothetical protein